ncbi:flagellar protein FliS [Niameybacter massiliensis]|uniref:Flagellar protein FliS n=1 Tax=Holtiella tumoricola TaxID=3018743 RepID=A0AA42DK98_9FIRM|nr:flagellar protein FliS [Holtiella tumoricola]MDA3730514.1 flagellar protein FliS [Holtiella tumoricola]
MVTTAYIAGATDAQLICVTYELFLEAIREALKVEGQVRKPHINRAREVLLVLSENLNLEVDVARNLMSLYIYIQDILINHYKDESKLEESYKLIEVIYEGYKEIAENGRHQVQTMQNTQAVYAGMTYGKDDLNEMIIESPNRGYQV